MTTYRVDVSNDCRGWATNALRFATEEEARAYASDLASRWMAVKLARVVSDDVPDRESVDMGDTRICVRFA